MRDARLNENADRTHRVYWGSHGCCLPYRHTGPCVCDCALQHVQILPDGTWSILVEHGGEWPATPVPLDPDDDRPLVFGEDVYGPPAPALIALR